MLEHALMLPTDPITLNIEMDRDGNGARTCWATNSFLYFSQQLRIPLRGILLGGIVRGVLFHCLLGIVVPEPFRILLQCGGPWGSRTYEGPAGLDSRREL